MRTLDGAFLLHSNELYCTVLYYMNIINLHIGILMSHYTRDPLYLLETTLPHINLLCTSSEE